MRHILGINTLRRGETTTDFRETLGIVCVCMCAHARVRMKPAKKATVTNTQLGFYRANQEPYLKVRKISRVGMRSNAEKKLIEDLYTQQILQVVLLYLFPT